MKFFFKFLAALGACLILSGVALGAGPKITIRAVSLVDGPEISLGEIAEFLGLDAPMEDFLGSVELGNSPRPGRVKSFTKKQLLSRLRVRVPLSDDLVFTIPDRVSVKRRSQEISRARVFKAVDEYLSEVYAPNSYEVSNLKIRHPRVYPVGEVALWLVRPKTHVDRNGRLALVLDVSVDDISMGQIRVSGRLIHWVEVLCAKRRIQKGERISSTDVYLAKRDAFSIRGRAIYDVKDLVGKVASSSLPRDGYIDDKKLRRLPLVAKGQLITLVARNNSIRIVTSGISKEDGCLNQIIRVENLRSGKLVRGRVKDASKVEVIY